MLGGKDGRDDDEEEEEEEEEKGVVAVVQMESGNVRKSCDQDGSVSSQEGRAGDRCEWFFLSVHTWKREAAARKVAVESFINRWI